ncbi:MAG: hypothetical protein CR997_13835 [Acidobacteria bacterium]|nr:MAG: hypothetical protein CR997_13835 [Acidobacteriota bacterium]
MNIFVRYPLQLGELSIAGQTAANRMSEAFTDEIFSVSFLGESQWPEKSLLEQPFLWIEGLFPLLSLPFLRKLEKETRQHKKIAVFMSERPDWGIVGSLGDPSLCSMALQDWVKENRPYKPRFDPLHLYPLKTNRDHGILNQHFFQLKREELMAKGVYFLEPSMVWVEEFVHVEQGVRIDPQVQIKGMSRIGTGASVGQGCIITDSTIETGAEIRPYSVIQDSWIGRNASVGPFAHIRPGSQLEENTRVGNFVETKKAKLGKGSKASHLTYLGDTVIGQDCNIGAGTITCNYDGYNKSRTTLGDRVFIGSDSQLIAPVNLGNDSYVGAGSTISKDVPANALAIARARQENKLGLAAKLREKARKRKESKS